MKNDIDRVLFSEEQLQRRIREMGAEISRDYAGKNPTMVCILKGAIMFYTDLVRSMPIPLAMDFMAVSSYGNSTKSSGEVEIRKDLSTSIENKHVVIVEDIVDTGATMKRMLETLGTRNPKSLHICTLLLKPGKLQVPLDIEYAAMEIPNDFIVGYGLDYDQQGRNLRDIYTVVE